MIPKGATLNPGKWLIAAGSLYAAFLIGLILLKWLGADRFWLGALNLYLPQIMWAVPGILLALLFFKFERALLWLPLASLILVFGPVMDLRLSLPGGHPAPGTPALRVMTWNVKYGYHDLGPLFEELERRRPDLVLFQDAVGAKSGPVGEYFRNWQLRSAGQYLVASRYPLSEAGLHELPSSSQKKEGFLRCVLDLGGTRVSVYNVHLKTPRRSLNALRSARKKPWFLPEAIDYWHDNVTLRLVQATALLEYLAAERGPVILAGDLNAPDASLALATLRDAGLRDAFAARGRGYGFTYGHFLLKHRLPWLKFSWMRIDHVMVNGDFDVVDCRTGSGKASDHRPVTADLVLKKR